MGHICLVQKSIKTACEFYKKGIELNSKDRHLFEKNFSNKYKALLELGVSENDILIVRDIFTQK